MKLKFIFLMLILSFFGCTSENAPDCFQKAGDLVKREITLENFETITVFEGIKVVIKESDTQKIEIETGEYLKNDISAEVIDGRLILRNDNSCNLVRDFGLTTVYISSPNISEIRSSTSLSVISDGVLNYPDMLLYSEDFIEPETATTDGVFDLEVNSTKLNVVANGLAYFKLKGKVKNLYITFASGDCRLEAEGLIADHVVLFHRSSNDMLVNPQETLRGKLISTGNVISYNKPTTVEVETPYKGKLIFE